MVFLPYTSHRTPDTNCTTPTVPHHLQLFNMQSITLQRMIGKASYPLKVDKGEECTGSIIDVFSVASV
jgi:hypothetical protein